MYLWKRIPVSRTSAGLAYSPRHIESTNKDDGGTKCRTTNAHSDCRSD